MSLKTWILDQIPQMRCQMNGFEELDPTKQQLEESDECLKI